MSARARTRAAQAGYDASRKFFVDLTDPKHLAGVESLLSRVYSKPVELNLIWLQKPHLDADLLASDVQHKISDRRKSYQNVLRDAAWKAQIPNDRMVTAMKQAKIKPPKAIADNILRRSSAFGRHRTSAATILEKLTLSQVSAVRVEAAGRLTKRISADRTEKKFARRGANAKGGAYMVRGVRKMFEGSALRAGKRRIGAFGIRAQIFHT